MSTTRAGSRGGSLLRRLLAVLAAVVLTLVAACGGGDSGQAGSEGTGAGGGDVGGAHLKVAVPPSIFGAAIRLGVDNGTFADAGLDVETVQVLSAAEGLPQLLSGELQFAIIETQAAMQSVSEGMPIVLAAPIADFATEPGKDGRGFASLVVLEGKGIETPKQLEGKSIGTNSIGGSGYYAYYTALENEGVDVSKVQWVETPGPRAIPALRQGQVDSVVIAEPQVARALNEGGVEPILTADDVFPGAPQFGFAASTQWLAQNEATAKTFMEAVLEANEEALNDRPAVEKIIGEIVDLPPELLSQVQLPPFSTQWWTPDQLEPVRQMVQRFKIIDEPKIPANDKVIHVYR